MMTTSKNSFVAIFSLLLLSSMQCHAQLSSTFYDRTCPTTLTTIGTSIRQAVSSERRMTASIIHLHFTQREENHDLSYKISSVFTIFKNQVNTYFKCTKYFTLLNLTTCNIHITKRVKELPLLPHYINYRKPKQYLYCTLY